MDFLADMQLDMVKLGLLLFGIIAIVISYLARKKGDK